MKPVSLGAYRLIAKLGRGRVTDVYLAQRDGQPSKQGLVVIKRLRTDPSEEVHVASDAQLALRLRHTNIAQTFEVSQHSDTPYWAMEYVEGQPLDRVLSVANRSGGLPLSFGLRLLCELLAALEYAHNLHDDAGRALGIVHRDVRPHNIFVSYQGELKLLDFGIPRPSASHTTDLEAGRASYVAPEQALSGSVDRRSDVFAVGLVMWELLSKQRRAGSDASPSMQPELTEEPPADVNAELSRISDRALEREPDRRYASAQAMHDELAAVLERLGDPGAARVGSLVQRLFKSERNDAARRNQLLLAVDTAPSLPLAAKSGTQRSVPPPLRRSQPEKPAELSEPRLVHAVAPASEASPSPKSEGRNAAAAAAVLLVLTAVGITWSLTRPEPPPRETQTSTTAATRVEALPAPVLRLCGSNTVGAELAPALVEALFTSRDSAAKQAHKRNIDSDVTQLVSRSDDKTLTAEVTARGTATAFTGMAEGHCDVGMASRAIDAAEVQRLKEKDLGDLSTAANEHVIALDGVAVVVHPNNTLSALDHKALHAVFTGKISDWSELGASPGQIHVLARDDQSGTYDTFQHLVLGQDKLSTNAKRYVRSDALADAVASDPAAIGFVGLAYVRTAKALAVGEAGAAPLLPTQFTVATESYMLSRRLYFYTPDKPSSPWVTELVNFALSARGQEVVARAGFVSLSLLVESARCAGQCSPRYLAAVEKAQRVSVDLRFRSGSNQPDSRARRDLDRLVKFLQNFREARVLLLGFSDGLGNPGSNQKLSLDRARTIADELARRGVQASAVTGFGSETPVATNETELGRERNRRVEVWFEHL